MKTVKLENIAKSIKELALDYLKEEDDLIDPDTLSYYKSNLDLFKSYLKPYSPSPVVEKIKHSLFMLEFLILLESCHADETSNSSHDIKH